MHLHFIGVGGTLIGHLAVLAKQAGHRVSGSDQNIYPPMSEVLLQHQIQTREDWCLAQINPKVDLFILGNAGLARGHPAVEHLLTNNIKFLSGAQWLREFVLVNRWVLAVSGTHGKTSTSTMLAWILEHAGLHPGFMIGGIPKDFDTSARLSSKSPFFVVEADEYDTSYFDRQAKFLHYWPRTLIINNIEYDHADIYPDLAAIQQQFHLLLRTVPSSGQVIVPAQDNALNEVLEKGLWAPIERFSSQRLSNPYWQAEATHDGFCLYHHEKYLGQIHWPLQGEHNIANALAAIVAANHAGVTAKIAIEALSNFSGVKRRLENIGHWGQLTLYDDFAHHPTAIATTLEGLRTRFPKDRIIALIEPGSHTMARGDLADRFTDCTKAADLAIWQKSPRLAWSPEALANSAPDRIEVNDDLKALAQRAAKWIKSDRPVRLICMSNQSFGGLVQQIAERCTAAINH